MKTQPSWGAIPSLTLLILTGAAILVAFKQHTQEFAPGTQQMETSQTNITGEHTFKATLNGSNEVPTVETEAEGSVTVILRGDSIYVEGSFSGLSSEYAGSYIYQGAEGENGDRVLTLKPEVDRNKRSGRWKGAYRLDAKQAAVLQTDDLYLNVHSVNYREGEIRGQLIAGERR